MALSTILIITVAAVAAGFFGTCALCLDRTRVRQTLETRRHRIRDVAPYIAVVGTFFVAKFLTSEYTIRLSERFGWNITDEIYQIEGEFVAVLQRIVPDVTVEVFSALYMFGFPYLLATAPILYVTMSSLRQLKKLLIAYLLNHAVGGVVLYTLFIAFGPRNYLDSVDGLMYGFYPQTQELTAAISDNTNVFPSLHTSLSVVVLIFAWRTRREFPRWFVLAAIVASGVVFSTMYLGIHWGIDIVAGIVLALWSVAAADYIVGTIEGDRDGLSTERDGELGRDPETGD